MRKKKENVKSPEFPRSLKVSSVLTNVSIDQESTKDTIRLLPDEKEALVEELGRTLNLWRVGWIFTDLIADDVKKGTVIFDICSLFISLFV